MNKLATLLLGMTLLLILSACGGPTDAARITDEVTPEMLNKGEAIFKSHCASCHSATQDKVLVGPSMVGIADRAGTRVKGLDAYEYIQQSILEPEAFINEDFPNVMPQTFSSTLTEENLNAVIQYLLHLD